MQTPIIGPNYLALQEESKSEQLEDPYEFGNDLVNDNTSSNGGHPSNLSAYMSVSDVPS